MTRVHDVLPTMPDPVRRALLREVCRRAGLRAPEHGLTLSYYEVWAVMASLDLGDVWSDEAATDRDVH